VPPAPWATGGALLLINLIHVTKNVLAPGQRAPLVHISTAIAPTTDQLNHPKCASSSNQLRTNSQKNPEIAPSPRINAMQYREVFARVTASARDPQRNRLPQPAGE